jgi:hypothetical protein
MNIVEQSESFRGLMVGTETDRPRPRGERFAGAPTVRDSHIRHTASQPWEDER